MVTTYTLTEAARIAGCSTQALRAAIARGRLHASKLGRAYVVTLADLQTYRDSAPDEGGWKARDRAPLTIDDDRHLRQQVEGD